MKKGGRPNWNPSERRPSSQYCIVMLSEHGGGVHLGWHSVTADGHEMCCRYVDGVRCPVASALPARRHPIDFHAQARYFFFFKPSSRPSSPYTVPFKWGSLLFSLISHGTYHHKPGKTQMYYCNRAQGSGNYWLGFNRSMTCGRVMETSPSSPPFVRSCSPFAHLASD